MHVGRIILVNVENKAILHTDDINSEITFMLWSRKKTSNEVNKPQVEIEDQREYVRDSVRFYATRSKVNSVVDFLRSKY